MALNDPQVTKTMQGVRSSQLSRIRSSASLIFGFPQQWFETGAARASNETFQKLLGAHMTTAGKEYEPISPFLYPDGSTRRGDLFLNPALAKVSKFSYLSSTTQNPNIM